MKKIVLILLAILMVTTLALGFAACKSDCENGNHDKYVKSEDAATCTTAKVEHWACHNCEDWTDTVTVGSPLGHDYTNVQWTPSATDANKHERTCTRCDYKETANHTTGAATCPDCGKDLGGSVQPCTHPNKTHTDDAATCTTAKVEHWSCPDCDWTEDKTIGEALGHDVKEWTVCEDDDSKHEGICTREGCGVKVTDVHHDVDGECQECGKSHEHDEYIVSVDEATCTKAKVQHLACHGCDWTDDITIGKPLGHNYEGQPWQADETTGEHYQVCKRDGCDERDGHVAAWGSKYVTTDATNHYKVCADCDLKTDVGEHDHNKLAQIANNKTQHSVSCLVCGKKFDNADHVWILDEQASTAATCTEEGLNVFNCVCGATKSEETETIDHDEYEEFDDNYRYVKCHSCNNVVAKYEHVYIWIDTDPNQHWEQCKTCKHIRGEKEDHDYTTKPEDFVCSVCGRTPKDVMVAVYYNGEYTRYDTLVAAVASITDDSEAVVYLGQSLEGAGIFVPSNRNITFRLLGNTYTVTSGAVGSTGTETQGFHIEKNSNITIANGTITSTAGSGVKMLVQNYANLTLSGMVLDGRNLDAVSSGRLYTLSNNYGTTEMSGTTIYAKDEDNDVAFDVWYGSHPDYLSGISVTVGADCNIEGLIEYGSAVTISDWSNVVLRLRSNHNYIIKFTSKNVTCDEVNIKKVNVNDESDEIQLQHRATAVWTCDEEGHHFHVCPRCGAHSNVEDCTKVDIGETKAATCTEDGSVAGEKCSVCNFVYKAPETVDATGHTAGSEYIKTLSGHAHVCTVCGKAAESVKKHAYEASVCTTCGYEISDADAVAILYALASGKTSEGTYKITGVITSVDTEYSSQHGNITVTITVGNLTDKPVKLFRLKNADGIDVTKISVDKLIVGDTVTVIGYFTNYLNSSNENEFEMAAGCTLVSVVYGNVTISHEADNATINGLGNSAHRYDEITFTVNADEGYRVDKVLVNNKAVKADENGVYKFTATGNVTVKVETVDDNTPVKHYNSLKFDLTADNLTGLKVNSYSGTSVEDSLTVNGTNVTFTYDKITKNSSGYFQIRASQNSALWTTSAWPVDITSIEVDYSQAGDLIVVLSKDADFTDGQTQSITFNSTTTTLTADSSGYRYFKFTSISSGVTYMKALKICSEGECEQASITTHNKTDATCTEKGNNVYYECDSCHKLFSDERLTTETTLEKVTIPAGHKLGELVARVESNCATKQPGHVAYYECSVCHKYFKDAQATEEIEQKDAIIPYQHNLVRVSMNPATTTSTGTKEYWKCQNENCDAKFSDAEGKNEIEDFENWVVIPMLTEECTHDGEYVWQFNADKSHCKVCSNCGASFDACDGMYDGELMVDITSKDNGKHDCYCAICEAELNDADCVYDNDNICTLCEYHKNAEVSVTVTINDGLTGKITIGGNELTETGNISLEKGKEVTIATSGFGATKITVTITVDGEENTDGKFTPTNDTHSITVTVSKLVESTTVTQTTFTDATSGNLDNVVSYKTAKGNGTAAPAISSNKITIYQNNDESISGGKITISVTEGKKIKSITIGTSQKTSTSYSINNDNADSQTEKKDLAANDKYTVDFTEDDVTSVTFYCWGSDKNSRLVVNHISVTYA